jgi:hypothetical protein
MKPIRVCVPQLSLQLGAKTGGIAAILNRHQHPIEYGINPRAPLIPSTVQTMPIRVRKISDYAHFGICSGSGSVW